MRFAGAICLSMLLLLSTVGIWAQQAVDRIGDPLPDGAIQRLGTTRMKGNYTAHAYLPDARGVLGIGTRIELWDLDRGEVIESINVARSGVHSLRVSKDGQRLLFRDGGDAVEWSLAQREELHRIATGQPGFARPTGHSSASVEYSPDETRVLTTGGLPPSLKEFELATGRELLSIDDPDALVGNREQASFFTHGIYDQEGKTAFVVGGYDHCVAHYDLATGEQLHRFLTAHHAYSVELSADGERILVACRAYASEWQIDGYKELQRFRPGAPGAAYTHDPDEILHGTRNGQILRRNRQTTDILMQWQRYFLPGETARFVQRLEVSPCGNYVLAYGRGAVTESELATGRARQQWDTHDASVEAVAWLVDGRRVASGSADGTLRVWDAVSGETLLKIDNPEPEKIFAHVALAASADGTRVAAGCYNGIIREFSLADGRLLRRLEGHSGYVRALRYTADGQLLSAADDGTARLWQADGNEAAAVMEGHRGGVMAIALSPDATRVATGGRDATVRIWDLETAEELQRLEGHQIWVSGVGFADSNTIVSAGADERIVRWDIGTGAILAETNQGARLEDLAVSADGTRAYVAGSDGTIFGWDLATGEQVGRWSGHQAPLTALALSPDGTMLVSGSMDSTLLVWQMH